MFVNNVLGLDIHSFIFCFLFVFTSSAALCGLGPLGFFSSRGFIHSPPSLWF